MKVSVRSLNFRRIFDIFQCSPRKKLSGRQLTMLQLEDRSVPATFTVTNLLDSGAGSLRQAILDANALAGADDIVFSVGLTGTISPASTMGITDPVTITGPGSAKLLIDGSNGGTPIRAFTMGVPGGVGTVTLSGMTISNCSGAGNGGSIQITSNGTFNYTDLKINNSLASGAGGAISAVATLTGNLPTITLDNCHLDSNTAFGVPGGGHIGLDTPVGGTGVTVGYQIKLLNSSFSNGNATGFNGGAATFRLYNGATLTVIGCTFENNQVTFASGNGGALSLLNTNPGQILIQNSTFVGNQANTGGNAGAIQTGNGLNGDINIFNCTFTQNSTTTAGGVFAATSGTAVVVAESSIFWANSASKGPEISGTMKAKNSFIASLSGITYTDQGGNQIGVDPILGPIGDNGGPTRTIVPGSGSPVREAGSVPAAFPLTTDQRGPGFPRLLGSIVDVGAVESTDPAPLAKLTPTDVLTPGGSVVTFTVTYSDDVAMKASTFDNKDIRVTNPALSYDVLATKVSVDIPGDGTPRVVTYSVPAPGGSFDFTDNGVYTVSVEPGEVTDTGGLPVKAGPIGSFIVGIPASFIVTNTNDSGPGSLRQAIEDANKLSPSEDIITFATGVTGTITLTSGELLITEKVKIIGPGKSKLTVDGNGSSRVFSINSPTSQNITITDLTIANGVAGDGGAGLRIDADVVNLNNVTLTGNSSVVSGGAVFIGQASGALIANNCAFTKNQTSTSGGAISEAVNATVTLTNCLLSENSAAVDGGVGFFNQGIITIESCLLVNNTADKTGGALSFGGVFSITPGIIIRNSTLSNNTAGTNGGAIAGSNTGTIRVQNSTITNNSASTNGGGIFHNTNINPPGFINIESSIVQGNLLGGAAEDIFTFPEFTWKTSIVGVLSASGTVVDKGGNLPLNTNPLLGPLANNGGQFFTHGLFPGSPAINAGSLPAPLAFDNRGSGFPRVLDGTVDIGAFEGTLPVPAGTLDPVPLITLEGATPNKVTVTYTDSVGLKVSTFGTTDIKIIAPDGLTTLPVTAFSVDIPTDGSPRSVTYTFTVPGGSWDRFDNGTYTVNLIAGEVQNVNGTSNPGIVAGTFGVSIAYEVDEVSDNDDLDYSVGKLSFREAVNLVNANKLPGTINFSKTAFSTAKTINMTGGAFVINQPVTINGPAPTVTFDAGAASRVMNTATTATISNLKLVNGNLATGNGAGLLIGGKTTLNNVTVSGNKTAGDGGGIAFASDGITLTANNSTISNNVASANASQGGGVFVPGSTSKTANLFLNRSTVSGNQSGSNGGGIYFAYNGGLVVTDSTISGNTALTGTAAALPYGGGGIYFFGNTNANGLRIVNSTISGNQALQSGGKGGYGGGIYLTPFNGTLTLTLQNSTIANNDAKVAGGGITVFNAASFAMNSDSTIIARNTSGGVADDFADLLTNKVVTVAGDNNLIGINAAGTNFTFNVVTNPLIGTKASPINPLLLPLALNGAPAGSPLTHALQETGPASPAINQGNNNALLTFDQRGPGFDRVRGGKADIGAFEVQSAAIPAVTKIQVNNAQANTTQRSRILNIDITFGGTVNVADFNSLGQITLTRLFDTPTGGTKGFVVNTGNGLVVSQNGTDGLRLTFTNVINNGVEHISLADGRWELKVNPSSFVSNDANPAQAIRRLYGDFDGNGTTDGTDFGFLGFGSGNIPMDYDNNGTVDGIDFGQFGARGGVTV